MHIRIAPLKRNFNQTYTFRCTTFKETIMTIYGNSSLTGGHDGTGARPDGI